MYFKIDNRGVITDISIGAIPLDKENFMQIDGTFTMDDFLTSDYVPTKKWDGTKIIPRTPEEINADRAKLPASSPTPSQQLAQLQADGISRDLALAELAAEIENIRGGTK